MTTTRIDRGRTAWDRLRPVFSGALIRPGDPDYDQARAVWNGSIERRPAIVARCSGVADVRAALAVARAEGLPIAVRGGGHNVAGNAVCDDGIVIDLSTLRSVHVDPIARTARVGPGATWADVDRETQVHGLAVTGGLMSSTGVAGFTLGGGIGWLMRRDGLACDLVHSIQVVTVDGDVVTASETEHPDLFWALRGGGGNFGVVTSFEFGLRPVGPTVYGGMLLFPQARLAEVLTRYDEVALTAPDTLALAIVVRDAPDAASLPEAVRGTPIVAIAGMHLGDVEDGEAAFAPLRALGGAVADLLGPKPYTAIQAMTDPSWEPGFRNYWKADYLRGLGDGATGPIVEHAATIPTPISDFKIMRLGGAVARVPAEATAFVHRDAPYVLNINTRWTDPAEDRAHVAWTRSFWEAMRPYATGGTYVNFLGDEGADRVKEAYGSAYERLARIKGRYDPENLLRLNQNIPPRHG